MSSSSPSGGGSSSSGLLNHSLSIRQEIQRFESVHPSIYAIYDLIELVPDPLLAQQIREHVVCIEGRIGWVGVFALVIAFASSLLPMLLHYVSEVSGILELGNVWVLVQLIHRPKRTKNQLYKNPNNA